MAFSLGSLKAAAIVRGQGCRAGLAAAACCHAGALPGFPADSPGFPADLRADSADRLEEPPKLQLNHLPQQVSSSHQSLLGHAYSLDARQRLFLPCRGYAGGNSGGENTGSGSKEGSAEAEDDDEQSGPSTAPADEAEALHGCMEALEHLRPSKLSHRQLPEEKDLVFRFLRWITSLFPPVSTIWAKMLRIVDRDFDEEDFNEGVTDAFCMVNSLISSQDWKTLEPMVSPGLLERAKKTHKKFEESGYRFEIMIKDIEHVGVSNMLWQRLSVMQAARPQVMSLLDSGEASSGPGEAPAGKERFYLLVGVTVKSEERWLVTRLRDNTIVKDVTEERDNYWLFGRGPVVDSLVALREGGAKDRAPVDYNFEEYPWHVLATALD
mmetsp:Transcript_32980/g.93408  ORF Transcript_32980/g.93408 Transcript_32980/m.93408 type:complete len:381 (+) Transcript_32980:107-1249(+)|eukprot:CAMPEP_0117680242 /NCGR_PEP_ID=MMETSP0804-20121206/18244_1 /TAXON_ID=1074897 /ORGANISM="Tetraselmis astigmatica, Strain CCMP880" /LENGTH=380 /DNA_ID=CAMNT_0005489719 /DNA_START=34 /DNA_END=1176 /DNA_ORIENTATION=+